MFTPKSGGLNTSSNIHGSGDRSFTSASARAMAAAAARRRSTGVSLLSSPARRSPFTAGGRTTPLNRSFQAGQVTESGNGQYSVESFGSSLPALVMEALTFADKNAEVSAVLAPSGWAWLVVGRRLLIWRYQPEGNRRIANHQFRELTLPSSDLSHRAQLVNVFSQANGQVPSCIAVSPEGFVRYWTNITHEGTYVEVSTDLQGQECDNILFLSSSLGCFLSTTTSTIIQVQPVPGGVTGAHIVINHLKPPTGILGGISRRVSSLVFGSMPTHAPEARLVGVVCLDPHSDKDERSVVVLSARTLQKWVLSPGQPEKLLYECEVDKIIQDTLFDFIWGRDKVNDQFQMWLISVQPVEDKGSIMILTAVVNLQISQHVIYCLVTLNTKGAHPPQSATGLTMLVHPELYENHDESVILTEKLLLFESTAFVYSKHSVFCLPALSNSERNASDRLDFSSCGDSILGAGKSSSFPLFFSANHGVVSIIPSSSADQLSSSMNETAMNQSMDITNITILGNDATLLTSVTDSVTHLQNAFLQYYRKNITQTRSILDEFFPANEDTGLDNAVVELSKRLLDDIPASDPRWPQAKQSSALSCTSTTSLIIANQIKDKMIAHQYLISFLNKMGIWQRLSSTVVEERKLPVRLLLSEHCELLHMTSELKKLHQKYSALVDAAIRFILSERDELPTGQLSNSDIFYRKISQVTSIFWGLIQAQDEVLSAEESPTDSSLTIYNVNSIFLSLLKCSKEAKFTGASTCSTRSLVHTELEEEYVPWYSSEGPLGLRCLLEKQHGITVESGLSRAEDNKIRGFLFTQLVDLADEILTGFQPHLSSLSASAHPRQQTLLDEYQRIRYSLLQPLVKKEQFNQAFSLAEKFCDFRTLVELCEKTNNQDRLNQYIERFGVQGFSDFVFRWYLETGKSGKLLGHATSQNSRKDLSRFLQDYDSLAWLHQINCGQFDVAHNTLKDLALRENTYLFRKKSMLSISKLCSVAAMETNMIQEQMDPRILMEEDLLLYQEQLPESVLNAHSITADTMRVFSPKELILLYISEDNTCANEFDFKKTLDLLDWIDDPSELDQLKRLIWSRSILRDVWDHMDTGNPIEAITDTVFFRTVELAFTQGCDLKKVLISSSDLMKSEELSHLVKNPSFEFLIKAGYEKLNEIIA